MLQYLYGSFVFAGWDPHFLHDLRVRSTCFLNDAQPLTTAGEELDDLQPTAR